MYQPSERRYEGMEYKMCIRDRADLMLRKLCNKSGVHAIVCQGNSHVGFAAAVGGTKAVGQMCIRDRVEPVPGKRAGDGFTGKKRIWENDIAQGSWGTGIR